MMKNEMNKFQSPAHNAGSAYNSKILKKTDHPLQRNSFQDSNLFFDGFQKMDFPAHPLCRLKGLQIHGAFPTLRFQIGGPDVEKGQPGAQPLKMIPKGIGYFLPRREKGGKWAGINEERTGFFLDSLDRLRIKGFIDFILVFLSISK